MESNGRVALEGVRSREVLCGGRRLRYDCLRIVCALSVAFYHFECSAVVALPPVRFGGLSFDFLGSSLNIGTIAVEIFFLMSGLFASKTLLDDDFRPLAYYKKRLLRLWVPFWISWTLACLWKTYWTGGQFFASPAKAFPLTLLGLDGYLAVSVPLPLGLGSTFYLVGEWFLGALVVITLLWPLVRMAILRFRGASPVVLGAVEVFACLFPDSAVGFALRFLPLAGLFSFGLGAYLGTRIDGLRGNVRVFAVGGVYWRLGLSCQDSCPRD